MDQKTRSRGPLLAKSSRKRSGGGANRSPNDSHSGSSRSPNQRRGGGNPSSRGGSTPAPRSNPRPRSPEPPAQPSEIELPEQITVKDLAEEMARSPIDLIKELMNAGIMANINQLLDRDTATIVAEDMGYKVVEVSPPEPEVVEAEAAEEAPGLAIPRRTPYTEEEERFLRPRPPVVTILGHVDHGKTSLLDVIRSTSVQAGEAGGITQHIGAYQVHIDDKAITFLDTPGHAAFTAMRARGASVTDMVILVVAADDGVQPQTREAIDHARAADVPIIVAINKMDLDTANPDRVMQQLAELGLVPEDWGGETICVPVSARTHMGIDSLLEMILLVSEMADFKANPRRAAQGAVIEGRLDRSRGATATLLVQDGILKVGDAIIAGQAYGRIRAMFNHTGKAIKRAAPSTPVVVLGLRQVPEAGDIWEKTENERAARDLAAQREQDAQVAQTRPVEMLTLEDMYARAQAGNVQTLNLILKADVQGSLEPIQSSLEQIDVGDLKVRFVHQGVGNIGESDVMLAVASQAVIIGFNVIADTAATRMAEVEGISIRTYDIIYRVIEDIQLALTGMLEPEFREVIQGEAIVRQVFSIPRLGKIAGSQVRSGKALRNAKLRVKRGAKVLYEGQVGSLKRFTEDVREVSTGMECGIGIDGYGDLQEDDIIEFYTLEQV